MVSTIIRIVGHSFRRRWQFQRTVTSVCLFNFIVVLSNVHDSSNSENLESFAEIALLFHLLEYFDVDQLDYSKSTWSRLYSAQFRPLLSSDSTNSVFRKVEKTKSQPESTMSQLPLLTTTSSKTLPNLQSVCDWLLFILIRNLVSELIEFSLLSTDALASLIIIVHSSTIVLAWEIACGFSYSF